MPEQKVLLLMAECHDKALLLRRIPYGETSLICHFLTPNHGNVVLMVRGARRPKSPFRASLEPLFHLHISWRPGRTGMGGLVDIQRGASVLVPALSLQGLELLAIVARLYREGDPHGFDEALAALARLQGGSEGLYAAVWHLLYEAGWLGALSHCWQCGVRVEGQMHWQRAQLTCPACSGGMLVSLGLRKSIAALVSSAQSCNRLRLSAADVSLWRDMIRQVLLQHDIKLTDSFR